jgi:hypothetical protein
MKRFLLLACALFVSAVAVHAQTPTVQTSAVQTTGATQAGPVMTFQATTIDYGTIDQGADPIRKFTFTNTGTEPLIIKSGVGSCGCTVPSYSKEPIMPGASSTIEVHYDTHRVGPFTKTVTLTTNEVTPTHLLTIKGEVKAPAALPPAALGDAKGE